MLLPISILIVPIVDLLLAVVRRTRAGRSPFAPDKQHLHHRLLEIGHSQRRAVFIMWMWAGLVAFGTVLASLYTGPADVGSLAAMALLTIVLTFVLPIVHKPQLRVARRVLTGASGDPVSDASGLCASFHKHPARAPTTGRPPPMTTALRRPHLQAHRNPSDPRVRGPAPLW